MTRHLLLLFLSDVKSPGGHVARTPYKNILKPERPTMTTNESAVRYLLAQEDVSAPDAQLDHLFLIASNRIRTGRVTAQDAWQALGEEPLADGAAPTHLAFFRARLKAFGIAPESEDVFFFDEGRDLTAVLEQTTDIAHRMYDYICRVRAAGDDVVLHVDVTGGFRHANMIVMDIVRLLQYSHVTIGRIIYSHYVQPERDATVQPQSYVEELGDIYRMTDLAAGAEEFARFGSVKTLQDYFDARGPISDGLWRLLDAMDRFASEIQLCHRDPFTAAIHELREALDAFAAAHATWRPLLAAEEADSDDVAPRSRTAVNDKLMLQLVPRLRHDYEGLFAIETQPLVAVRWCLGHGYLQQALTLLTEVLPRVLLKDDRFLTLSDAFQAEVDALQNDPRKEAYRVYEPEFFFWNHYFADRDVQRVHPWLCAKTGLNEDRAHGKLKSALGQQRILKKLRGGALTPEAAATAVEALQKEIVPEYAFFGQDTFAERFAEPFASPETFAAWVNRHLVRDAARPFLACLHADPPCLTTCLTDDELRRVVNGYAILKKERNAENHAKKGAGPFPSAAAVQHFLANYLRDIEALRAGHRG